jgi:hypothetical protein
MKNCVDLFYNIGASRGKDIIPAFSSAVSENKDTALRIAQWARDIRGGSGERKLYRDILLHLANTDASACSKLIAKTPEIGRFDDLLVLAGTSMESEVFDLIATNIDAKNGLCCKWLPRKGPIANKLRSHLKMTPKQYRKTIVGLTNVVEQQMCAKDWANIEFDKVPSVASARYQKAFGKNATEIYGAYIKSLEKGETKINAGAVYPYDVVKSVRHGNSAVADQQWLALPNYMEGSAERVLPIVDVSGSMSCPAGKNGNVTCMDVAISLGLYIAERGTSIFKDKFITFSTNPQFQSATGSLSSRVSQMERAQWDMTTNIEKVFALILSSAKMYSVPEKDMPTKLLILSDMQFDQCARNADETAMNMITRQYEEAGYKMPQIVFWNLNSSGNVPTTFNKVGVALVSGFSPAIMKNILACKDMNPEEMMKNVVNVPRYDWQ